MSSHASYSGTRWKGSEDDNGEEQRVAITSRIVIIRFTGSDIEGGDLKVRVDSTESVKQVINKIRSARPPLSTSSLRLIHSGRLLTPGILLLPWLNSLHARHAQQAEIGLGVDVGKGVGEMIRGAEVGLGKIGLIDERGEGREERYSKKQKGKGVERDNQQEEVWLHCVVGTPTTVTEEDQQLPSTSTSTPPNESDPINPTPRPRGFNALLEAGLNPAEVEQVRRQFYQGRGEEIPSGFEADDEHVRALEEQWIEGDLTNETAQTTNEGIYTSTLQGILVGFLFPLMAWSVFKEPPAPNFFEPFEVEPGRGFDRGSRESETLIRLGNGGRGEGNLNGDGPVTPRLGDRSRATTISDVTGSTSANATSSRLSTGTQYQRTSRPFTLRGQAGGEWIVGVAFGTRVQLAILLGTILNLAFGALRFLA